MSTKSSIIAIGKLPSFESAFNRIRALLGTQQSTAALCRPEVAVKIYDRRKLPEVQSRTLDGREGVWMMAYARFLKSVLYSANAKLHHAGFLEYLVHYLAASARGENSPWLDQPDAEALCKRFGIDPAAYDQVDQSLWNAAVIRPRIRANIAAFLAT